MTADYIKAAILESEDEPSLMESILTDRGSLAL
jgi:hypothetical protein